MGYIKRDNCGIAQRSREREPPPHKHTQCRRAASVRSKRYCPPYIVALETEALIALAITLHLAKR